ncbi:hypothetical protein E2562_015393 [Oryza meyeriana var. granulata]|uniref:Integrase catalytic domain-containing protein n=1 Tax=Oryza meyeriana var. granulata TaxID=110450 RepID=A0A6G1EJV8_9ORYZ|nr:hypothetical protein E2562_015393 [Oryza meyeriana var. granulata]
MPLPVPQAVWTDIGLDFVEALPRVGGKSVILTVVDRFSKYCHFIALAHPYSAESMARAFFTDIVRLHGVPQSMVSDRDPVFTSTFWRELMRLMGTRLHMSTAFHPQSDGQTEAANRAWSPHPPSNKTGREACEAGATYAGGEVRAARVGAGLRDCRHVFLSDGYKFD